MESGRRRPTKQRVGDIDYGLIFCVFVLIIIGLIMIYSTSAYEANIDFEDSAYYLKRQMGASFLGIFAMIVAAKFPYKKLINFEKPAFIIALISMSLLLTPLAYSANGATRWIRIFGISIQPAEIVKLMVIVYMAAYLTKRTKAVTKGMGALLALAGPMVLAATIVIGSSNLSSGIIVAAISIVMLFVATPDYKKYIIAVLVVVIVAAGYIYLALNQDKTGWTMDYRADRVIAWINPEAYASDEGYQTLQSLYAIGSGGIKGKGIGESIQKLGFIPEAQNDMIFAIICEELGLIGAFFVMIVFVILIRRCMVIATEADSLFGSLLATGVMAHLSIQVILNIAVVTNTMPNTGISLPFISYGGTSILFLMAEIGLVLNVGRDARRKK